MLGKRTVGTRTQTFEVSSLEEICKGCGSCGDLRIPFHSLLLLLGLRICVRVRDRRKKALSQVEGGSFLPTSRAARFDMERAAAEPKKEEGYAH